MTIDTIKASPRLINIQGKRSLIDLKIGVNMFSSAPAPKDCEKSSASSV